MGTSSTCRISGSSIIIISSSISRSVSVSSSRSSSESNIFAEWIIVCHFQYLLRNVSIPVQADGLECVGERFSMAFARSLLILLMLLLLILLMLLSIIFVLGGGRKCAQRRTRPGRGHAGCIQCQRRSSRRCCRGAAIGGIVVLRIIVPFSGTEHYDDLMAIDDRVEE